MPPPKKFPMLPGETTPEYKARRARERAFDARRKQGYGIGTYRKYPLVEGESKEDRNRRLRRERKRRELADPARREIINSGRRDRKNKVPHLLKAAAQRNYQKQKMKPDYKEKQKIKSRTIRLKHLYGMTLDQYENLLAEQEGKCRICRNACPEGKYLSVDHCHKTGKIRGLLCSRCNVALGCFKDSTDNLEAAILYLREYE